MTWKFAQNEECYYINHTRHIVEKSRARHSLRGRITEKELYEIKGRAQMDYFQPYKTVEEATIALKKNLKFRIKQLQDRLEELEPSGI